MQRRARLGAGAALERVFREGVAISNPFLVWRFLPNELGHARWAFAVGKRLAPRAVQRNVVRRRLREAARRLGAEDAWDIVVIAKAPALGAPVVVLEQALRELRERAQRRSAP